MVYFITSQKIEPSVVFKILDAGLNTWHRDQEGENVLQMALQNRMTPALVVQMLVRFGAPVN